MQTVSLGPLGLSLSQLLLLAAFVLALLVGAIAGRRHQVATAGTLSDIFLAALVCARIGFVVVYLDHYRDNLWTLIDIRDGGFSIASGLAGAIAVAAWKLWRHRPLRRPLTLAMASGLIFWGSVTLLTGLIESQYRALPEARFSQLDGTATSLHELADGRPLVVNLWASWCPPCIREMPVLQQAQRQHPDIAFVFVNQGEHPEIIRTFLQQQGLTLDNVLADPGGTLGRLIGSQVLPTTLFYNRDGRQVDTHIGMLSPASLAHNMKSLGTHPSPSGDKE